MTSGVCLQAKLTDSEKKLSELSAKLEHMAIEKSALENRNNILEKVLVMRDQEICKYKAEDHTARHQVGHSAFLCIGHICWGSLEFLQFS